MTQDTGDRRRYVLAEIATDAERDVQRFEGQPFTGKTVAEYMGCQAAAIKALAEIVETLLPDEDALLKLIRGEIQDHAENAPHLYPDGSSS